MTPDHEDYPLSDELRTTMCKVLTLGFMDRMSGQLVEDNDIIQTSDANAIYGAAETLVDRAAKSLADAYVESPDAVHAGLYMAGVDAAEAVEAKAVQRN